MNLRRGDGGFQKLERRAHAGIKHLARHLAQLRFRVVQVININRLDTEVTPAAFDLIGNKTWRYRVAPGSHIALAQDTRGHTLD